MFDFENALKNLPNKPGVYMMKDENEHVIYVGKAKILKNRVRQYFHKSSNHTPKIARMVSLIRSFEYIVTDSEVEALILENNLIKKYWPKYNTMLKDDKTYPYIKVTINEPYPRVLLTREIKNDKAKYYGPYANAYAAKESIDLIRKLWKIRTCHRVLPRDIGKERPCLNYHIDQCEAPCYGYITKEEYVKKIEAIVRFLNGNYQNVLKEVESKMLEYSENLEFEKAGKYRDYAMAVKKIMEKQKIAKSHTDDRDILAVARNEKDALVQVYFVRTGKLVGREHFRMENTEGQTIEAIITSFIKQFYSGTALVPKEILMEVEIEEEKESIENWLSEKRGSKVYFTNPKKGEKNKLLELAKKNVKITLDQFGETIKKEQSMTIGAVKEVVQAIGLKEEVSRIEAYDISNLQGVATVGSMVVFENGKPKKSDYRKFRIKFGNGPDDYGSMKEVLTRRFEHALQEQLELIEKGMDFEKGSFTKLPDLILMDGGKGQVNIALQVLTEVGLEIPVCGMVKDDHHRTRGLYYQNTEIPLDPHKQGFKLITRIQDEAHRFAIDYHRKTHKKEAIRSILDDIQGIGPKRRMALMQHFKGIENIKKASLEELKEVESMNEKSAKSVVDFFAGKTEEEK